MSILNLTQHQATPDQLEAGVVDLPEKEQQQLQSWLTFTHIVPEASIVARAQAIAHLAHSMGYNQVMIGGALWLMAPLTQALYQRGITPLFAFSTRETTEMAQADGSVIKSMRFKHDGFIVAPMLHSNDMI